MIRYFRSEIDIKALLSTKKNKMLENIFRLAIAAVIIVEEEENKNLNKKKKKTLKPL